jgi:hypothetical protein
MFARVHRDVEQNLGVDSLYNPVSEMKAESRTKAEIAAYLACESAAFAEGRSYVRAGENWYRNWLAALLFDERNLGATPAERWTDYDDKSPDDRRRAFSVILERTLPEAVRAPLVIYRLLPLAAHLATAQAFDRLDQMQAQRDRQLVLLPSILDCTVCDGRVLDPGKQCSFCGNPFWKHELLTAE